MDCHEIDRGYGTSYMCVYMSYVLFIGLIDCHIDEIELCVAKQVNRAVYQASDSFDRKRWRACGARLNVSFAWYVLFLLH